MKENITLLIPKGEIEKAALDVMRDAGLDFDLQEKCYQTEVSNFPITFVRTRASSIPTLLARENSYAKAGITGSDILWQAGLGKDCGTEIPIFNIYPEEIQPRLYLGATESYQIKTADDVAGKTVYSKFDLIGREYFAKRGVSDVEVVFEAGGIEAMQYIFDNTAIIDVWVSGRTALANNIQPIDFFYDVVLRMITRDDITKDEQAILDDLMERITILNNSKQTFSTKYL